MSGTARRRGPRGQIFRSEPPAVEDPEALEDDQADYGDENASPQREDGAAPPILTPNTAQLELEERTMQARRDGKRPVERDAGEMPASPPLPESSTLPTERDVQLQARLAKVSQLEQQLLRQIELTQANAQIAQLEEKLHSISAPFQVREDTRVTESIEPVGGPNKQARGRPAGATGRIADLQAHFDRATLQSRGDSQQASTREGSRTAQSEHRKRHHSSSEGPSKRRHHYCMITGNEYSSVDVAAPPAAPEHNPQEQKHSKHDMVASLRFDDINDRYENSSSLSSSSQGSESRMSRRVHEQNAQSKVRPLAPKTESHVNSPSAEAKMPKIVEAKSDNGTAEIPRTTRQQPPRKNTFCSMCNDHPQGFHGDHELRRHIERHHTTYRKVWICKDNSEGGGPRPAVPLSDCKACRNHKTYGAHYNAAAHLRHAHFYPCKSKRGRGMVNETRGGMGGSEEPPMEELKNWMYEQVEVNVAGSLPPSTVPQLSQLDTDMITDYSQFDETATYNNLKNWMYEPVEVNVAGSLPPGTAPQLSQLDTDMITDYNHFGGHKNTFCSLCNDHPQGFHNDHELRRHIERHHTTYRKVWICKDNSEGGGPRPAVPLSNCKACRNHKTYGANYNAAAHLRRAHFYPCKNKRGDRQKISEHRGGMGGGEEPPMEELKNWMYEQVKVADNLPPSTAPQLSQLDTNMIPDQYLILASQHQSPMFNTPYLQ